MATLNHDPEIRDLIADTVTGAVDAGGAAGTLNFYTTNGGTLLATLTFTFPNAFGTAASGTAAAASITEDANTAAGTVAWFEVHDSNGNTIFEGDVTSDDVGTGSILLSSVALGTGDTLSVSSLSYSAPS